MSEHAPAPKSLLLVDDSPCYRDIFERAFRRAKIGTTVWPVSDGRDAIERLKLCGVKHAMPDLVLLDRALPGGPDGFDVLRAARSLSHLAALPIVMISSSGNPDHIVQAEAAGADGYLLKSPVQDDYAQIVGDVLGWWRERREKDFLRTSCAAVAIQESPLSRGALQSGANTTVNAHAAPSSLAAASDSPLGQFHALLQAVYGYIGGGNEVQTAGMFADRKLVELTRACREVGIDETDATGRSQDPVLVLKRGRVMRKLMSLEWADTELQRRFPQCKRTIVDQRKQWREEEKARKSCVVVARGYR